MIIPAFNAEDTLPETLASVLGQTWSDFEVLVVDDGSSDGTAAIAGKAALQDERVRVCRQENRGVAEARNRGIRESQGEWIAPLDADDLWTADHLESGMRQAQAAADGVAVLYAWSTRIDDAGRPMPGVSAAALRGKVFSTLLCHNFLGNGSCTLIRRKALEAVGGYHGRFSPTEDWDLYLRLAERYEFAPVPRLLVQYRQRPRSASSNHALMAERQAQLLGEIRRRNPRVPAWLCALSQSNLYLHFAKREGERGNAAARRGWLERARQAHWFSLVRPDWWWLRVCGGTATGIDAAPAAPSGTRRQLELRSQLIGATLLHASLRLGGRYEVAAEEGR